MKQVLGLGLALIITLYSISVYAQEASESVNETVSTSSDDEYYAWASALWESFTPQTGIVSIDEAKSILTVPEEFYYLNAKDSEKVLVDVWGNPPSETVLGMLFPAGATPFDSDSWAVTIEYEEDGYVSDSDADDIDYNDLLEQMKDDALQGSKERVKQGYPSVELVGWASAPFYDKSAKKLHWAKEISFSGVEVNTLNYNIRVLGRRGVLVLNFIASIEQKSLIEQNLDSVLNIASFNDGAQYADFDPDIDTVAAYGLGALVAGKLAAKAGLFAVLLVFLKKFGIFLVIGIGALFKRMFSKK